MRLAGVAQIIPIDSPFTAKQLGAIADEIGRLTLEIEPLERKKARLDQLKKLLRKVYESADPEAAITVPGDQWEVELSPCSIKRTITSMPRLKAYLGLQRFMKHCTFKLEAIDDLVPVEDREPFLLSERTGPRSVKPIQKEIAA